MTAATDVGFGRMRQDVRLRILLIEDDPNDAELVQACLAEAVRGGAEIGKASPTTAGITCAVTQTGVWLLDEEYL